MKKILAIGALASLTLSAFGQGQVSFNNRNTTATPNPINSALYLDTVGGVLLAGTDTQFRAALLGGATTGTPAFVPGSRTNSTANGTVPAAGNLSLLASPASGATWATFRTGTLAGFFATGTDTARDSGLAYGSTGLFQVVAWNGGYNTWAQAYAAWVAGTPGVRIGASNPLTLPVTQGPTDLAVPTLQGLESFAIVTPVPEPSTFALAGLGAAALLIFRRRK